MGGLLVLVFIVVPILEIIVFIQAGELIGLWPTVAGIVLTAVIGAAVVRHQGLATLRRGQKSLAVGQFPITPVFDGLCIVFSGALLITPGFITDTVGFLLLVPAVRKLLRRIVLRRMMASGRVTVWSDAPSGRPPPRQGRDGIVIDAEYEHVPERPEHQHPSDDEPGHPQGPDESRPREQGASSPWRRGGANRNTDRR